MDNNTKGWKVAAIVLGIVVIILLGMMWHGWNKDQRDIDNVVQEGYEDITDIRARIAAECNGPEGVDAENCQRVLSELADTLEDFQTEVQGADLEGESGIEGTPEPQ